MQPKVRMKKALQVSTLVLSLGSAFTASADLFPVTAGAIPDVVVTPNNIVGAGGTELNFGSRIKLNPAALSECTIVGATNATEAELGINTQMGADLTDDLDGNTTNLQDSSNTDYDLGDITGQGCIADATGDGSGETMVFDIDASDDSFVTVSIPDVAGTGWVYTAGAESCVVKFDQANTAETCETFAGKTSVINVPMASGDQAAESGTAAIGDDMSGTTRLLLAGTLVFDGTPVSAPAGEIVTISIMYE